MLLTNEDKIITADEARAISEANNEDTADRYDLRKIMEYVRYSASFGKRTILRPFHSQPISEALKKKLEELGYSHRTEEVDGPNGQKQYNWHIEW